MKITTTVRFALLGFLLQAVVGNPIDVNVFQIPEQVTPYSESTAITDAFEISDFKIITAPPAENQASSVDTLSVKKCECAVFDTEMPTKNDQALIIQSPADVSCDVRGKNHCRKLCSDLSEIAQDCKAQLLCSLLGHRKQLWPSVHSRICGVKEWTYTGISSPTRICCHKNEVIDCKDLIDILSYN